MEVSLMTRVSLKTALAAAGIGALMTGCATTVDMGGPLGHYRYHYQSGVAYDATPTTVYRTEPTTVYKTTPTTVYRTENETVYRTTPSTVYSTQPTVVYSEPTLVY